MVFHEFREFPAPNNTGLNHPTREAEAREATEKDSIEA